MRLIVIFLIAFEACLAKEVNLLQAMPKIAKDAIFQADFSQKKSIKGISKPLVLSGTIILWNGKGLLWQTKKPFSNQLYISSKGIFQIEEGVKNAVMKGHQDNLLMSSLCDILSGDLKALQHFSSEILSSQPDHQPGQWKLKLTPLPSTGFQKIISFLILEGDQRLTSIFIQRKNGDHDRIDLLSQTMLTSLPCDVKGVFDDK